jgi:hypothetical protein
LIQQPQSGLDRVWRDENGFVGHEIEGDEVSPAAFRPAYSGSNGDLKKLLKKHSMPLEDNPIIPILWPIANKRSRK